MDFWGVLFGIWFGVGSYRLFEMFEIDAMNAAEGYDEAEEYGVSKPFFLLMCVISAYGWPIFMPIAYWMPSNDEEE